MTDERRNIYDQLVAAQKWKIEDVSEYQTKKKQNADTNIYYFLAIYALKSFKTYSVQLLSNIDANQYSTLYSSNG